MERSDLRQYRYLNHEVNMIQDQIDKMRFETDAVKASDKEFPFIEHHVIIGGYPNKEDQVKKKWLEARKDKCQKTMERVEDFINRVDDSLIRQLLTYRYMEGLKWNEIAGKIGGCLSEVYLRKKLQRFLDKN